MKDMISCCGLDCGICPVYIATKNNDDAKRKSVAESWSKMFNMSLSVNDINCNGCMTRTGILFGHCRNCPVRQCSIEHNIDNCGYCPDYSCARLDSFLERLPNESARRNLDIIRKESI